MARVLGRLYKRLFSVTASKPPLVGGLPSSRRLVWKAEDWGLLHELTGGPWVSFILSLGLSFPIYKGTCFSGGDFSG